jgi:hypothetical protein
MWKIDKFNDWVKKGRPINKNVLELNILQSNIDFFGKFGKFD